MRNKLVWKVLAISIALVMVASSVAMYSSTDVEKGMSEGGGKGIISLVAPLFVEVADAREMQGGGGGAAPCAGTTFLEEEAGISAYTNVGQEIDLEKAKSVYRTIEYETDEYVIGSVELSGYPETEDVHVYVHKDGWIVGYYLNGEPAAKIIDWLDYQGAKITSTKLEDGIAKMCDGVGVALVETKYYDFRATNANRLMIIADAQWEEGTDTFDMKISSDFTVYGRSWSHYARDSYGSTLKLNGDTINSFGDCRDYWVTNYGTLTPTQLKPDVFHTVSLWHDEYSYRDGEAFGAIVLVYREA